MGFNNRLGLKPGSINEAAQRIQNDPETLLTIERSRKQITKDIFGMDEGNLSMSEGETFRYMAQMMLDQEKLKAIAALIQKKKQATISAQEFEMLVLVERCKAFDRIFEQEGIDENELNRCAEIYKLHLQPQYRSLQLEVDKVIRELSQ